MWGKYDIKNVGKKFNFGSKKMWIKTIWSRKFVVNKFWCKNILVPKNVSQKNVVPENFGQIFFCPISPDTIKTCFRHPPDTLQTPSRHTPDTLQTSLQVLMYKHACLGSPTGGLHSLWGCWTVGFVIIQLSSAPLCQGLG